MKWIRLLLLALLMSQATLILPAQEKKAPAWPTVVNRVRYYPAPDREKAMLGGKFAGSNVSATEGFVVLAEIKAMPPANQWTELRFENRTPYRWVRYEAPPGSHGAVADLEFYAGERLLHGRAFGSIGWRTPGHNAARALDGNVKTWFECERADGVYVGRDLGDLATARRPELQVPPGEPQGPMKIALASRTPGAVIRYTLDGTTPGAKDGLLFKEPIRADSTTTVVAVSFKDGFAPSPATFGTVLINAKPGCNTFHLGNSITNSTNRVGEYARTAGYRHDYHLFVRPGAKTHELWEKDIAPNSPGWREHYAELPRLDHITAQPRDFDIAREAKYEVLYFDLIREKSPQVQPWLYAEWTDRARNKAVDRGQVPSRQMKTLPAAHSWEESAAAMLLYVEDVRDTVRETYKGPKPPRVLPSVLAAGWLKPYLEQGKIPGLDAATFDPMMFGDSVHPGPEGAYLIDLTWFAAFYRESPEGKVLPVGTNLNVRQAAALQKLAWDVVKNYPDCGLYEEGTEPAGRPTFATAAPAADGIVPVTLASATTGAWFRYTLDGTEPTRTRGYVYCGKISVRPGMTVKAVAYKSGQADSAVAELTLPAARER